MNWNYDIAGFASAGIATAMNTTIVTASSWVGTADLLLLGLVPWIRLLLLLHVLIATVD